MSLQRLFKFLTSIFTISIVLIVLLISCSTKKNMFTSRAYHNLTARYNVYFNAKEALKAGEKAIEAAHKDNYINAHTKNDKTPNH